MNNIKGIITYIITGLYSVGKITRSQDPNFRTAYWLTIKRSLNLKRNPSSLRHTSTEHVKTPSRGGDISIMVLQREAFYISTLYIVSHKGLNLEFNLKPFVWLDWFWKKTKHFSWYDLRNTFINLTPFWKLYFCWWKISLLFSLFDFFVSSCSRSQQSLANCQTELASISKPF